MDEDKVEITDIVMVSEGYYDISLSDGRILRKCYVSDCDFGDEADDIRIKFGSVEAN